MVGLVVQLPAAANLQNKRHKINYTRQIQNPKFTTSPERLNVWRTHRGDFWVRRFREQKDLTFIADTFEIWTKVCWKVLFILNYSLSVVGSAAGVSRRLAIVSANETDWPTCIRHVSFKQPNPQNKSKQQNQPTPTLQRNIYSVCRPVISRGWTIRLFGTPTQKTAEAVVCVCFARMSVIFVQVRWHSTQTAEYFSSYHTGQQHYKRSSLSTCRTRQTRYEPPGAGDSIPA